RTHRDRVRGRPSPDAAAPVEPGHPAGTGLRQCRLGLPARHPRHGHAGVPGRSRQAPARPVARTGPEAVTAGHSPRLLTATGCSQPWLLTAPGCSQPWLLTAPGCSQPLVAGDLVLRGLRDGADDHEVDIEVVRA